MDFLLDTNFLVGLRRQPTEGTGACFPSRHAEVAFGPPWVAKRESLADAVVVGHDTWSGVALLKAGVPLLTRNVRDLSRIDGLQVVDYAA